MVDLIDTPPNAGNAEDRGTTADPGTTDDSMWPSPLVIAACASIGAGAIHASVVGAHGEHRTLALLFVWSAAAQLMWGIMALLRHARAVAAIGLVVNLAAAIAWFVTRITSVSFIEGLEQRESIGFADASAAGLAVVALAIALGVLLTPGTPSAPRLRNVGLPAFAVAALTLPAMLVGGTAADHHAEDSHSHSAAASESETAAVVPPKPYDPSKPIDLSGVEGVTPEQQARAESLVTLTLTKIPQFANTATAIERGWRSIGDSITGFEHFINWSLIDDGVALNPDAPESLVYRVQPDGSRTLVSAMYMLPSNTPLEGVPDVGGRLTQWHIHDDLCFTRDPEAPRVAGLTRSDGTCRDSLQKFPLAPMIHVWIVPHECGPFAALEGIGAGQIAPGEQRWCDHAHGSTGTFS
ncbi:MAG: hypothetical protein RL219_775 [Actinomycetota bacterium]